MAFVRDNMDQDRLFHILGNFQQGNQFGKRIPINRSQIGNAHIFKKC